MSVRADTPGSRLSRRICDLHASPIREILSVIDTPGMVSFAGGLPAPETFPALSAEAIPRSWLQYGPTEGEPALRERVAEELRRIGLSCAMEQVLILSGSQQGIDLAAKLFVDPGTPVAVESPTYLAALQVFRFFGARFVPLDLREPRALTGTGIRGSRPALAYSIPTFQNPTGRCYSTVERDALAQACDERRVTLFEDDPYRDLAYDDCDRSPICGRLRRASWIYQGSFSKSLAPGLRLGFLAASRDLVEHLTRLKQAADLHSNRVSQWLVLQQLNGPARAERLAHLVDVYRRKRDDFAGALRRHLGTVATWQSPPGGLFFWLALRRDIDTRALLPEAIRRGVAFMPGESFFPESPKRCGALRLNFTHADETQTERGLATLAELLR
ncbi:MAG: PLP-dependent aminotransferase family protein [Steroidobacteraceae bacterium]